MIFGRIQNNLELFKLIPIEKKKNSTVLLGSIRSSPKSHTGAMACQGPLGQPNLVACHGPWPSLAHGVHRARAHRDESVGAVARWRAR
jgi:hypothetical protein